ncbi:MAG: hypothetical protein HKN23_18500 [Verrucomicrobiales bacterium]|nr:hypothetical protein [Verrucomicrobiales bacterium]
METKADPEMETRKALARKTMDALEDRDAMGVLEDLIAENDGSTAVQACGDLMNHFYWQKKNLGTCLTFARAGLQHGLVQARGLEGNAAVELQSAAKALAYDLASFTWPGWNEEGMTPSANEVAEGFQAARTNLRLAQELKKPALPMSRAWWMLAAHEMGAGNSEAAIEGFQKAAELADEAEQEGEKLLSEGFAIAVEVVQKKDGAEECLAKHLQKLRAVKDGEFFAGQIETALKVYSAE